jgi:ribose transport system substrate-binding protein
MKKLMYGVAALAAAALALAGCASGDKSEGETTDAATAAATTEGDSGGGETGGIVIKMIAKANASDYWTAVKEGALAKGEELGVQVEFNGPDTEQEGEKQLSQLQTAVNSKPSGIAFAPQDSAQDGAPAILDEAKAAGIPVVAFDTPVKNSDVPFATIASNNVQIGEMAAEHMHELLGEVGSGKIGVVAHGDQGTAADRRDGFVNKMTELGYTVLDPQNGNSDPAISRDKAQALLTANPDMVGFFGTDDDSVIAIAAEVSAKGMKDQVVVVGVDASADEITMVKEGQIDGALTQNPGGIGAGAVELLVNAANGQYPDSPDQVSPAVWYTAENLNSEEVVAILGEH